MTTPGYDVVVMSPDGRQWYTRFPSDAENADEVVNYHLTQGHRVVVNNRPVASVDEFRRLKQRGGGPGVNIPQRVDQSQPPAQDRPPTGRTREQILADLQSGILKTPEDARQELVALYRSQGLSPDAALLRAQHDVGGAATTTPPRGPVPTATPFPTPEATLEQLFGTQEGRAAHFREAVEERLGRPAVGGTFRNVIAGLQNPLETAFMLQRFQPGTSPDRLDEFRQFLAGQSNLRPFAGGSQEFRPQLQRAADVLGMDMLGAGFQGLSSEEQLRVQGLQESFGGPEQQRTQFGLALNPFLQQLPWDLRGPAQQRAMDEFQRILASQGQDPKFQMLPYLAQRGFKFF